MQHFILRRDTIMVHTCAYAGAWLRNVDICTLSVRTIPRPSYMRVPMCVCACIHVFVCIHVRVYVFPITPGYGQAARNFTRKNGTLKTTLANRELISSNISNIIS